MAARAGVFARAHLSRRPTPMRTAHLQLYRRPASSLQADGGADYVDPRKVVRVLHRVQEILGAKVEFPRVVMVGDQSSGKTSVIEALIGEDISCKDSTMATRRPLLLSLIRTSREAMKARFGDGETVYSFEAVKERLMAENDVKNTGGLDISDNPIELTIYSKDVFDTILVDLPGFVTVPQMDQSEDLPKQIMDLNTKYLKDPNSILAVDHDSAACFRCVFALCFAVFLRCVFAHFRSYRWG